MKNFIVSIRPADAKEFEFQDCFHAEDPEAAVKAFVGKYSAAQFRHSETHDFRVNLASILEYEYFRVSVFAGCDFRDIQQLQENAA